jgi:S-adenosylmethionine:tRNA ribosyltransferase-isomerase
MTIAQRFNAYPETDIGNWSVSPSRSGGLQPPSFLVRLFQTAAPCSQRMRARPTARMAVLPYSPIMSERLSDYDYVLPEELIAQRPLAHRDESRMMILHRSEQRIEHRKFAELGEFLSPGDLLVLNNTRVLNARRFSDDGKIEFLFLDQLGPARWKCLVKPGRKMRVGGATKINGAQARVEEICAGGERVISLGSEENLLEGGVVPLPPYIGRQSDPADVERYQTVFAETPGAIAAPTAGLHFTPEILAKLPHTFITLHVGAGTFQPVKTEKIADHRMHEERYSISESAAAAINASARIVAVGTTTVRVLESATRRDGQLIEQQGKTDIFIHPPAEIRQVQSLLTNFHLPRSTLLMLVSAFAGREFLLTAYAAAIGERYRFYSYGDCMLIL